MLESMGITLLVTTYQAGKLVVFRSRAGKMSMLLRTFDKAMGLAADTQRLSIATGWQVWSLANSPQVASKLKPPGSHDACYIPRTSHVTGAVDVHEIVYAGDELWVVNTLFSCLATLAPPFSFVPRWRPSFVSELARQDRCHLNGLAVAEGRPAYVTVFGQTNDAEGWRPNKVDGGCIIEIASGRIVAEGLSMPHSPRVHDGRLWVLDSGRGRLAVVDGVPGAATGAVRTVVDLPGYTRGLAFLGRYAFVGLSKIRETAIFGGVPIADAPDDRQCGVFVVDVEAARVVGFLRFEGSVEEIFDVQIVPGVRFPSVVGFSKDTIKRACVIGPERPIA
ncbi:MAG: TIGR03032 family protein [Phycisphaeraceae bacterium]|nr:TIGR03032 family protein [Phycisphaeraceae bacterium]